jgi:hypothetical protein
MPDHPSRRNFFAALAAAVLAALGLPPRRTSAPAAPPAAPPAPPCYDYLHRSAYDGALGSVTTHVFDAHGSFLYATGADLRNVTTYTIYDAQHRITGMEDRRDERDPREDRPA